MPKSIIITLDIEISMNFLYPLKAAPPLRSGQPALISAGRNKIAVRS